MGKCGHHTVEIDLEALPKRVHCLIFTCSKFKHGTLSDIVSPSAALVDGRTNRKLCMYSFDATSNEYGKRTAVVMCALVRNGEEWALRALGELSDGRAGSDSAYMALRTTVKKLLPS